MRMNKKGGSEIWWIIVVAVVALVVMIVLIVMFTGRSNRLELGLLDCESKGGSCGYLTVEDCRDNGKGTPSTAFECKDSPDKPCCFGTKKKET